MKFTQNEIHQIHLDKIFIKKINNTKYWIKPLIDHKNYPLGNSKSHRKYFNSLKKYLKNHLPETKFFNFNSKITLIIQKNIFGRKITTLKEIKELLKLKQNKEFRKGIKILLEKENWVIDLYNYKGNFIVTKNKRLYFIDGRMPIFPEPKEDRYQISKKRTLRLLRQTEQFL